MSDNSPKILPPPESPSKDDQALLRSSYYKPKTAELIRSFLDLMLADNQDKRLRYDKFGKTPRTLLLMVLHGWKYLRNHMDTEDKRYSKLWEKCEVKMELEGVCIRFTPLLQQNVASLVESVAPRELTDREKEVLQRAKDKLSLAEVGGWKRELREWMEGEEEIWDLRIKLTEEDVTYIMGLLGNNEKFAVKIGEQLDFIIVIRSTGKN